MSDRYYPTISYEFFVHVNREQDILQEITHLQSNNLKVGSVPDDKNDFPLRNYTDGLGNDWMGRPQSKEGAKILNKKREEERELAAIIRQENIDRMGGWRERFDNYRNPNNEYSSKIQEQENIQKRNEDNWRRIVNEENEKRQQQVKERWEKIQEELAFENKVKRQKAQMEYEENQRATTEKFKSEEQWLKTHKTEFEESVNKRKIHDQIKRDKSPRAYLEIFGRKFNL